MSHFKPLLSLNFLYVKNPLEVGQFISLAVLGIDLFRTLNTAL